MKVVVDHTNDPNAYVGDFELIHSQEIYTCSNVAGSCNLLIEGRRIEKVIDRSTFKENSMKIHSKKNLEFNGIKDVMEFETSQGVKYVYIKQS